MATEEMYNLAQNPKALDEAVNRFIEGVYREAFTTIMHHPVGLAAYTPSGEEPKLEAQTFQWAPTHVVISIDTERLLDFWQKQQPWYAFTPDEHHRPEYLFGLKLIPSTVPMGLFEFYTVKALRP